MPHFVFSDLRARKLVIGCGGSACLRVSLLLHVLSLLLCSFIGHRTHHACFTTLVDFKFIQKKAVSLFSLLGSKAVQTPLRITSRTTLVSPCGKQFSEVHHVHVQGWPANFLHYHLPTSLSFLLHTKSIVSWNFLLHVLLLISKPRSLSRPGLDAPSITISVLYLLQESNITSDKKLSP